MVGLDTALGLVKTRLIDKGYLSWTDAIRKLTVNPAPIINQPLGDLSIGNSADLSIIDPEAQWTVDPSSFKSKSRNTPFTGWELSGKVVKTILRGSVAYSSD